MLANAGVDVFEEVFKLIFIKLYDEFSSSEDKSVLNHFIKNKKKIDFEKDRSDFEILKSSLSEVQDEKFRIMEFRNRGKTDAELQKTLKTLFDQAKEEWGGVFSDGDEIKLSDSHLSICVSSLQNVKLFNSNLMVVDEAFEYLVSKSAKGDKGQYFTPRHVIDMCVKMLNPRRGEYMIDTAAGSCGFPVHTLFKLTGKLFTNADLVESDKEQAQCVFGIDFDERTVRVARTLNLISGDGQTNVLHLNTLDYKSWEEKYEGDSTWMGKYAMGYKRLKKLREISGDNQSFNFDIVMANPPFAGGIKESRILHSYDLSFNAKGKASSTMSRDILFIERNLDFLKPGGRMAIVLPQGRLNNKSDQKIRRFISDRARILAVVGLHGNTFKPHTPTKTSVLFVQKWHDELCPRVDDYPIFFAISEKSGKDNSGDYIFVEEADRGSKLDKHGHLIVNHDLHNHDGETEDGIAEAFIDWAQGANLSFW